MTSDLQNGDKLRSEFGLFHRKVVAVCFKFCGDVVVFEMRREPEAVSAVFPHTLASMNSSVKALRPHFPFNDLLDSGTENQRGGFS